MRLRAGHIFAATILAFGTFWLGSAGSSAAKLDPYYVARGLSFGKFKPRVLFVLDTSGSMSWLSSADFTVCTMQDCEGTDSTRSSRIASARQAIQRVIDSTQDVADFSLMTFAQLAPPKSSAELPERCYYYDSWGNVVYHRFYWLDSYTDYYSPWLYNATINGMRGRWRLCGANRPFPYLRWDNLGSGSVVSSNNQAGNLPASPLVALTSSQFPSLTNKTRKVQFFPQFMGIRINLNDTTDPGKVLMNQTYGDYGNDSSTRLSRVWKQDFYYWPYVDGFPGYGYHYGYQSGSYVGTLGVGQWNDVNLGASLYSPFYLKDAAGALGASLAGPVDKDAATQMVLSLTSDMSRGGVDADGGTPWASTIGAIPASVVSDNRPFAHKTVASYLKFVRGLTSNDVCLPQVAVLVTDGDPDPVATQGGSILHQRLSELRRTLDTKVYVVGFAHDSQSLANMACAAAGSDDYSSPCFGAPADNWDTCSSKPSSNACAYIADNTDELSDTLTKIVGGELKLQLESGPDYQANEYGVGAGGKLGEGKVLSTSIAATTEVPAWKGHVSRGLCTTPSADDPNVLAPECMDEPVEHSEETFGPCPRGRVWDGGACLAQTAWNKRRLYFNDANNNMHLVANANGEATAEFIDMLNDGTLALPGRPYNASRANAFAAFLLGKEWPEGWKLPGLAKSAPMVVRRIPALQSSFQPRVMIADPHCAGRLLAAPADVPTSLASFAEHAWSADTILPQPSEHREYQEAALVGDDLGVLHAFQLDSGNELWGFLPRFLVENALAQFNIGSATRGQPGDMERHIFGLGGTPTLGWVFDKSLGAQGGWRHLAIITAAAGGSHLMALDVSHMSPMSPRGPIEVLWTSADHELRNDYEDMLGQTWSRPSLTYHVKDDNVENEPTAFLVFGAGAKPSGASSLDRRGRYLMAVDALTGRLMRSAKISNTQYSYYGDGTQASIDVAVATHCASRYWAEAQEAYAVDSTGSLYRWDLARETSHAADSATTWSDEAKPLQSFRACVGTGLSTCTVGAGGPKMEPFVHGPAVAGLDRIDEERGTSGDFPPEKRDEFLIALVGGGLLEEGIDAQGGGNDYHPSLYLIADNHRSDRHDGVSIPKGAPITTPGSHAKFMRIAISSIQRTRKFRPIESGPMYTETRKFTRFARPVGSPRITVGGFVRESDGKLVPGYEVYYIEYTIYEPSTGECDAKWHDTSNRRWIPDEGSTYVIRMRLLVKDQKGFDFIEGAGGTIGADTPDKYGFIGSGLTMLAPEQVIDSECADGICGPKSRHMTPRPCDDNATNDDGGQQAGVSSIGLGNKLLHHFSPVELEIEP